MRLGIHYSTFPQPEGPASLARELADTVQIADSGGVQLLTVMDHWFQLEPAQFGGPRQPMIECYTTLGYLAGITRNIKLGALVTGVTYRYPALLAKTVTTLDVLSEGRAIFGIGAAWYAREHRALGVPFPSLSERFERLDEAIRVCLQMWSGDEGVFDGQYCQLAETVSIPAPLQLPHPPILIGGGGERKTLRLVAKYGQMCNLFGMDNTADTVRRKLDVLRQHCDDLGRDYTEIQKTVAMVADPFDDFDGFLTVTEKYAELGVDSVMVSTYTGRPAAWATRVVEEIVPRLEQLR
ncbi:LLM class F420-dependent oxidoreductase [Mycolicibacterium setense]|uniref:LLM class F420-dependent oxidoreductase n=1 Tax=Mycolicibacterium setense TaxID=431269 RepID=UPI0007EA99B5|nr:LLM class F420-dependent oxidoreductase [Mycolicibacterium setense]OBB17689.1 LLM class F420-dependent oxidoreductase [Mycolicibacterium setense]